MSHNRFTFYDFAIQATVVALEWDDALRYCDGLEAYVAADPFPWAEFIIARGRALARHGQGDRSPGIRSELQRLCDLATRHEMVFYLGELAAALAEQAR